MTTHIIILCLIIIIIGGLAGLISFLNYYFRKIITNNNEVVWHILSGIGASVLVPLLLNMLSSDLINYHSSFNQMNYFVFAGFCFIAGYFSDRFINSIGDKVLRDLENTKQQVNKVIQEAKDNEEKIDFLVSTETDAEEDLDNTPLINLNYFKNENKIDDDDIKEKVENIINAFQGKFSFRTIKGLAKDLKYSENKIKIILEGLEKEGVARRFVHKEGKTIWGINKNSKLADNVSP